MLLSVAFQLVMIRFHDKSFKLNWIKFDKVKCNKNLILKNLNFEDKYAKIHGDLFYYLINKRYCISDKILNFLSEDFVKISWN